MAVGVVRSHEQGNRPERIRAATGRLPDDWYADIDAAGGPTMGHSAIAAFVTDHGVDGWWAQAVTVGYEQSRGLRIPGQRSGRSR